MTPLVDYLIAQGGAPAPSGLAYDYVLGGDGLYLAARNRHLEVRVPLAQVPVRGLPPLYPSFSLRTGPIPQELWDAIVGAARAWAGVEREVLFAVVYDPDRGYRLIHPRQAHGRTALRHRPVEDALLEIHSHHRLTAHFSATDDADEQALRVYGVVGRLHTTQPEVALRVGAYGHFLAVPWEGVFSGQRGAFRDVFFDPPVDGESLEDGGDGTCCDDALPD